MFGRVLDSHTVEVDDETLAAVSATGGRALVDSSDGTTTRAELVHDGERYVLRLACALGRVRERVRVRPQTKEQLT